MNELLSVTDAAVKALCFEQSSAGSKPTTAVQKSTLPGIEAYDSCGSNRSDIKNTSSCSRESSASSCGSTFLTGDAKAVKVSKKMLKEIKSPFEITPVIESKIIHKIMDRDTTQIKESRQAEKSQNGTNEEELSMRKDCQIFIEKHKPVHDVSFSEKVILDSGYMTTNIEHLNSGELVTDKCNRTGESLLSCDELEDDGSGVCNANIQVAVRTPRCHQSDNIVTVPERIVTVNAREPSEVSLSSAQAESEQPQHESQAESEQPYESRKDRFAKFQPLSLKQGQLTDTEQSRNSTEPSEDEVHISQYTLTQRERILKNSITSKLSGGGAVRRVVRPQLVARSQLSQKPDQLTTADQPSTVDALTTAAVAAASAVAATQPFLQAQHQMEHRLAVVLEKLNLAQQPNHDCVSQCHQVAALTRELSEAKERRIDQLEALQLGWQAQLLAANGRDPPQHIAPPGGSKAGPVVAPSGVQCHKSELERSLLNTPAPRNPPPLPTSFETSSNANRKNGAFLEEILSAQHETPKKSPFPETPDTLNRFPPPLASSVPVQNDPKVAALVQDLEQLKLHMRKTIDDTDKWRKAVDSKNQQKREVGQEILSTPRATVAEDTAPLDEFMVKVKTGVVPVGGDSPPDKGATLEGDAPVITYYPDAKGVLQGVRQHRANLEANLDAIVRARHHTQVYSLLDQLNKDSNTLERDRIKKLVDDRIMCLNGELQREVLEDMAKMNRKDKGPMMMMPERGGMPKGKKFTVASGRSRASAKINTGLGAPQLSRDDQKLSTVGKENLPQKRQGAMLLENETYVNRVYGRQPYEAQRSTTRQPYLHYQTTARAKSPGRPNTVVLVKGVEVATTRTQTASRPAQQTRYYFDPSDVTRAQQFQQQGKFFSPSQGNLIPMAIPLGVPRKHGTIEAPPALSDIPLVTSTPVRGHEATAVKFKDTPDPVCHKKLPAKLTQEKLTSVDIKPEHMQKDLTLSPVVPSKPSNSPEPEEERSECEEEEEEEEEEEMTMTAEGSAIAVPGAQPRPAPYHGPAFPPLPPPAPPALQRAQLTSAALAAGMRQRDLLQDQAIEWIEQELMAKMITEMYGQERDSNALYSQQQEPAASTSVAPPIPDGESLVSGLLSGGGMQLFVDAGQPVDDQLVQALVKEVLLEKISAMMSHRDPAPHPTFTDPKSPTAGSAQPTELTLQQPLAVTSTTPAARVATPEPTPRTSLAGSVHERSERSERSGSGGTSPLYTPIPSTEEEVSEEEKEEEDEGQEKEEEEEEEDGGERGKEMEEKQKLQDRPIDVKTIWPSEVREYRPDVTTPAPTPPPLQPAPLRIYSPLNTPEASVADEPPIASLRLAPVAAEIPVAPPISPRPIEREVPSAEPPRTGRSLRQEVAEDEPGLSSARSTPSQPVMSTTSSSSSSSLETIPSSITPVSETAPDPISEGQWLISVRSEGECLPAAPPLSHNILRNGLAGLQRHIDDHTLFEMEDLVADKSEGEVRMAAGVQPPAPFLAVLANMKHPRLVSHEAGTRRRTDMSLGEVVLPEEERMAYSLGQCTPARVPSTVVGPAPSESAANGVSAERSRPVVTEVSSSTSVRAPVQPQPSSSGPDLRPSVTRSHPSLGQVVSTRSLTGRQRKPPRSPATSGDAPFRSDDTAAARQRPDPPVTPRDLASASPDRMNALLQSGAYLAGTYSEEEMGSPGLRLSSRVSLPGGGLTTSDLSLPTDLAASCDGPYNRTSETNLREYLRSLQLQRSSEVRGSDTDPPPATPATPATPAPRLMSVMIPSVEPESDSDNAPLDDVSDGV